MKHPFNFMYEIASHNNNNRSITKSDKDIIKELSEKISELEKEKSQNWEENTRDARELSKKIVKKAKEEKEQRLKLVYRIENIRKDVTTSLQILGELNKQEKISFFYKICELYFETNKEEFFDTLLSCKEIEQWGGSK